jgi:hypothetical protein
MDNTSRLFASLTALGINPKMESFSERKRVQKMVYLLDKTVEMNFNFPYNWYLHGPYSPQVTKIIYNVVEGHQKVASDPAILSANDYDKIKRLKCFLGKDIDSIDELELLVSVHYLLNCSGYSGPNKKGIVEFMREKKPYFTESQVCNAIDRLHPLIKQ